MDYRHIRVERDGAITFVTLARPQSYNALNAEAHEELANAFDAFEADGDQWVAIVTGEGDKAFCAGHDLKQQAVGGGLVLPSSGFAGLTSRFLGSPFAPPSAAPCRRWSCCCPRPFRPITMNRRSSPCWLRRTPPKDRRPLSASASRSGQGG